MSDLAIIFSTAMGKLLDSGKIEQLIERQLEATLKSVIEDSLRSYSDFGKGLQEHFKSALTFDPDRVKIPEYNAMVAHIVERKLAEFFHQEAAVKISAAMDEILKPAPAEMKFSELVETLKKDAVEDYRFKRSNPYVTVHVEPVSEYGSRWVRLDREGGKDKYSCEFSFLASNYGGISALRFGGNDVNKSVFVGGYYGFERSLFQLHAAKTKLIFDEFSEEITDLPDECHCDD
jgi:hypothetical protein